MTDLAWRKSSRCESSSCVELAWRKSSRSSDTANCVEVAVQPGEMFIRDSKDPDGPVLCFGEDAGRAFLDGIRAGEFDRS